MLTLLEERRNVKIRKMLAGQLTYRARKYEPMPTERWGVWKKLSRSWLLVALVPERRGAEKLAEKIAAAMNAAE